MKLASTTVGSGPRLAVVLHGILGSGRNWRTFCSTMARELPEWRFALPDLRGHGDTPSLPPPHTLAACAADLDASLDGPPDAIIGHSFGGKVALAWATRFGLREPVVVLDVPPWPTVGSGIVDRVLAALDRVRMPAMRRRDVGDELTAQGLPEPIVAWLLTSLRERPDGWRWAYDLPAVHALLEDHHRADFTPWIREHGSRVHVVRAGRSELWDDERFEDLSRRASTHLLAEAGHWVQVDDPEGLLRILRGVLNASQTDVE